MGIVRRGVVRTPLKTGRCHCDSIKFVLLHFLTRRLTNVPVSRCLTHRFCRPVKLRHALCLPLRQVPGIRVIPSTGSGFLHGYILRKFIRSRSTTFRKNISKGTKLFSGTHRMTSVCRVLLGKKRLGKHHCLDGRAYRLFAARVSGVDHHKLKFSGPSTGSPSGDPYSRSTPTSICNRAKFAKAYT